VTALAWRSSARIGVSALPLLGAVAACGQASDAGRAGHGDGDTLRATASSCDSAHAARAALDSLARLDPFRSEVYRYEADSAGVRIATWPAPGAAVTDGMAVVRVDRACRITSLVQTDSA